MRPTNNKPLTAAQRRLCEENIALVYFALRGVRYDRKDEALREELVSEGMVGLIRAARGFDPSLGFKFSTYAQASAFKMMWQYSRRRMSDRCGMRAQGRRSEDEFGSRRPTRVEEFTELSRVKSDRDPDRMEPMDVTALLALAQSGLNARQRKVLRRRFCDGLTLAEVGREIGVGKERVRQIQEKALRRCRWQLARKIAA